MSSASPSANLARALVDVGGRRAGTAAVALREGERATTYGELADRLGRIAGALRGLGVARGERVAIVMPDGIDAACAALGVVWAGAVAVPISELAREAELRAVLLDAGAVLAIVHPALLGRVNLARGGVAGLKRVVTLGTAAAASAAWSVADAAGGDGGDAVDDELTETVDGADSTTGGDFTERDLGARIAAAPPAPPAIVDDAAAAFLLYSAGARGDDDPGRRGVPHGHRGPLLAADDFAASVVRLAPGDRVFSLGRLWTAYGLSTGLLFPLAAGAEAIFLPAQPHTAAVFATVEHLRPTAMFATPSIYGQIARDAALGRVATPLAGLRFCMSAAETTPGKVVELSRRVLGVELQVGYGLTEALHFVLAGPAGARPGACGAVVRGFEVRLVGEDGAPVAAEEIGTLEVRGASIARAYWRSGQPTVDAGGWFRTPDRFFADAAGNHVHCGRVDQLFKVSGKWVAPAEVERALLAHEAVWECAVVGAEDGDGLVKPLAFVVPNIGHAPSPELAAALREWVKAELSPYKYPRWIEFVAELPKGPHGKILRYKLKSLASHPVESAR